MPTGPTPVLVFALLAIFWGPMGCSAIGGVCTTAACEDGVTVEVPPEVLAPASGSVTVRTCFDDDCHEQRFPAHLARAGLYPSVHPAGLEPGMTATVTLHITDDTGALLVDHAERIVLDEVRPNGPTCGPVRARSYLEVASRPVVEQPS